MTAFIQSSPFEKTLLKLPKELISPYLEMENFVVLSQVSKKVSLKAAEVIQAELDKRMKEVKQLFPEKFLMRVVTAKKLAKLPRFNCLPHHLSKSVKLARKFNKIKAPLMWGSMHSYTDTRRAKMVGCLSFVFRDPEYEHAGRILEIVTVEKFVKSVCAAEKTDDVYSYLHKKKRPVSSTLQKIKHFIHLGRIIYTEGKPSSCPIKKIRSIDHKRIITLEPEENFKPFKGFFRKVSRSHLTVIDQNLKYLYSTRLNIPHISRNDALINLFKKWSKHG